MEDAVVDLIHRPEPLDIIEIWGHPSKLELDEVIPVQEVIEDCFDEARLAPLSAVYDAVAAARKFPNLTVERLEAVIRAMGYRVLWLVGSVQHAPSPSPAATAA